MKVVVKVSSNSSKSCLEKIDEGSYKAYVKKPARDGKANLELLGLLKKNFGPFARILKGHGKSRKLVEVKECQ